MKMQFIPVKAVTAGERIGSIQCTQRFLRKRTMEHLRALNGVHNVRRIAWDIIYFETDEGIKAEDVLEAVHAVLPVFAAEMGLRPKWLIRNVWLLWGITFGICHLLDTVEYYLDGGTSIITGHWLAGLVVVGISLWNYSSQRRHCERREAFIREQCAGQLREHLKKEAASGGRNNDD